MEKHTGGFINASEGYVGDGELLSKLQESLAIQREKEMDELIKENRLFMEWVTRREEELQAVIWERDKAWETIERLQKENNSLKFAQILRGDF